MSGALLGAAILGGRELTLANVPASATDLGAATQTYGVQLQFQTDGELWQLRDIGADVDEGGWVDPESAAKTTDAVKYNYTAGDNTHNIGDLTNNTYAAISTNKEHGIRYTSSGGSDDISQTADWYLAEDTGGTGEIGPAQCVMTVGELF